MQFFKYLNFLITATNQHGVHSPFVYNYITKGIYSKEKFSAKKSENILLKTLIYFKISSINIDSENILLQQTVKSNFPNIKFDSSSSEFFYFKNLNEVGKIKNISTKNDSIVFIHNLHKYTNTWQDLIKDKKITISINLFFCGILFFRKEQAKENFKIRIYSSIFK
ncbi:hypothetical protein KO500_08935 [Cellulophaga baltica]|uniref:hypothetical protein n=1 Tax=Cellulophaga TaxID=104264 RepID=UPI001C064B9A|nr:MULTISPECIES: hypothetical protein [Cellulophaga]MBU2996559.1 hypothetical protein [Cellulophaga baltica]MDO6767953.1 hypothetical protein [Cellulophaga sp. 1_MG-2023]